MASDVAMLQPVEDKRILEKIIRAISKMDQDDFQDHSQGDDIAALSEHTVFDALDVAPEAVFKTNDETFEASAIVYVTLNYGGKRDPLSMPDSYPAVIQGSIKNEEVVVDRVLVDTSRFYD